MTELELITNKNTSLIKWATLMAGEDKDTIVGLLASLIKHYQTDV